MVKDEKYDFLEFVDFKKLGNWDYKSYLKNEVFSKYEVVLLGTVLEYENKKQMLNLLPEKEFGILGISNEIGMFDAYIEKGKNIKQPYKIVKNGFIAYNPYRINVGSMGIKTSDIKNTYISSAYVVFSCKKSIIPEYLYLLMKTDYFNKQVIDNTTGSVRQTLSFQNLSKIKIPLPPLEVQEKIVNQYNEKMIQAEEKEKQAKQIENEIEEYLFKELGISENVIDIDQKGKYTLLKIVQFQKIKEWEVTKISGKLKYTTSKYEENSIGESLKVIKEIFRGKSPKYCENSNAFILNQKCNRWNTIDLKYVKKVDKDWAISFDSKFYTKENDILINSTGEGTLGRSTCIKEKEHINLLYDSHLLLLRLNDKYIDSQFFVYLFNSNYVQEQINILKGAISTKQTELGIEKVKKIKIPIPPLDIQKNISETILKKEEKVNNLNSMTKQLRKTARIELQNEIFSNKGKLSR